jgi:DNA-binding NarL/FixJ family response regulator
MSGSAACFEKKRGIDRKEVYYEGKNLFYGHRPHIVLLNQYLKHGFLVWDVLKGIKTRNPNLPVLIVTAHDTGLFDSHLSQADGYLVKSHTAAHELREKISNLLNQLPIFQDNTEFSSTI